MAFREIVAPTVKELFIQQLAKGIGKGTVDRIAIHGAGHDVIGQQDHRLLIEALQ